MKGWRRKKCTVRNDGGKKKGRGEGEGGAIKK